MDTNVGKTTFNRAVSVDFDGCIADFSKGWQGPNVFGAPIEGASAYLSKMKNDLGVYIVIFTTRLVTKELVGYLHENLIPFEEVNGYNRRAVTIGSNSLQSYDEEGTVLKGMLHLNAAWYTPSDYPRFWDYHSSFPTPTGFKPVVIASIDDQNVERCGKQYDKHDWAYAYAKICKRLECLK